MIFYIEKNIIYLICSTLNVSTLPKLGGAAFATCFVCKKPGHFSSKVQTHCPIISLSRFLFLLFLFLYHFGFYSLTFYLSIYCPENKNGLYPFGGCCYFCKKNDHFQYNCPDKKGTPYILSILSPSCYIYWGENPNS